MSRTYTRLPFAEGIWQTNFVAIPTEFARAIKSSPDFANAGVVALRLNWTGPKTDSTETESKECYVGWNGALSGGPYIQVPDKLSEISGLAAALNESKIRGGNSLILNVYAVRNSEIAKKVDVEPVGYEDWEVLERHAGFVENQMLSQICVLYPNQTFYVWVANVPVKLMVKGGVESPCIKLANETEVIVAPKPRPANRQVSSQQHLSQQKSSPKSESSTNIIRSRVGGDIKGNPVTLRVQNIDDIYNGVALVNPSTLELMRSVADWDACGEDSLDPLLAEGQASSVNNPKIKVFCRIINSDSGEEYSTPLSLRISSRVAHGHIGLSRSSRRSQIKLFAKVCLVPVSPSGLLIGSPGTLTLRRIIHGHLPPLSVRPLELPEAQMPKWLNSDYTVVSPGCWLTISQQLYKVVAPSTFAKSQFWFVDNSSTQWIIGDDLSISNISSSVNSKEEKEHDDDKDEVTRNFEDELIEGSEWTLETLGGPGKNCGDQIKQHFLPLLSVTGSANRVRLGTSPTGGCYFYGPRGCGKTTVVRALAKSLGNDPNHLTFVSRIDCAALKGGKRSVIQKKFESYIHMAQTRSPSLVVFDDLDALLPHPANPGEEDAQTVWLSEFLENLIIDARTKFERFERMCLGQIDSGRLSFNDVPSWNRLAIGFLATGRGKRSLRSSLLRLGLFEQKTEMPVLDVPGRMSVLRSLVNRRALKDDVQDDEVEEAAQKTEGFAAADLDTLVERALHSKASQILESKSQDSNQKTHKQQYIIKALEGFTPSSLRGVKLAKSDTAWSDVGGLDIVREVLKETLELPFQFAELYDRSPQKLASGILLYGPPGCGKTLLAGAVASECGLNFISVKGPEVLNKYIGASEQAIRDLFARAASVTPCIIFFDEFDAVAPRRGSDSTGVTDRVVNQMLTFLDGVESRKGVYVMAATSRPDLVDPALLRPGRLDKQLYCGFPDEKERLSILQAIGRKLKLSEDAFHNKLPEIAHVGTDLTGADLQALLATAQLLAVHEETTEINSNQLARAFADTRPSVSKEDRIRLEKVYRQFRGDREPPTLTETPMYFSEDSKQKVALM